VTVERWISFCWRGRTSIILCTHLASPGRTHDQSPELTHDGGEDMYEFSARGVLLSFPVGALKKINQKIKR
jgi:hypothetical protein